ncbi:MAG: hypothetical protein WAT93_01435, partial [Pontixanthobacter sp.]
AVDRTQALKVVKRIAEQLLGNLRPCGLIKDVLRSCRRQREYAYAYHSGSFLGPVGQQIVFKGERTVPHDLCSNTLKFIARSAIDTFL